MSLKVGLVQIQPASEPPSVGKAQLVQHAADLISKAPQADIYVLPELAPTGYNAHVFNSLDEMSEDERLETAPCRQALSLVARERGAYICYGVPGQSQSGFCIRQVVLDPSGEVIASYDKIHLCDFGDCAETRHFTCGETLCTFDCKGFRVGLLICADIRYTELCRELAVGRGCEILLQPAAFARDVTYATWQSFVECRALENQVYWAAVNYAGPDFGGSMWCPPWVDGKHKITSRIGMEETVVVHEATKDELRSVKSSFQFMRCRKERGEYK
ncbi:unnamed protein product [Effrenium voratum]|uniref:CN hydrolase domain-containing protein n=1 Tax=Effrenium voratum TaxID=2562239 RepID=A0AA36I0S2_9DINO|nr:unnamed protein product [Effrenium voratum]CAJ1378927.1 unnamed protein product [Effrenium voratum]CAJ1450827.1 unnamed protein product [Effrenium voratum]